MEDAEGVLLLSHVGFSFMEDLVATVTARGLKAYVLSSLPETQHQQARHRELTDIADDVRVTSGHVLTARDLEEYVSSLEKDGASVRCCLTVWEGYRHLMALANARLGVPDLDEKQTVELRDKMTLRNRLADSGLSRSRARPLTPGLLAELRCSGDRYFVKPVSGMASFGTFPLTPGTTWADLERIADEVRSDTTYASAFAPEPDAREPVDPTLRPHLGVPAEGSTGAAGGGPAGVEFLVEDYVPGREFSFEVLVHDGTPHVVAVHEKCEVTETAGTVLENACVSPPVSLPREELAAGSGWVASVLDTLGISWGCFHIEARHSAGGWDLIEVNPRVGGSLISPSVAALTGGPSLLDLWLDSLLTAHRPQDMGRVLESLSYREDGTARSDNSTFFRVFFADPGTIRDVRVRDDLPLQPAVTQLLLKPGDTVKSSSREVFLGQLLWKVNRHDRETVLAELMTASEHAIEVVYETEQA